MTTPFVFSNFNQTTLAAGIGPSATSITVATGTGALYPSPGAGEQFALTLNDASTRLNFEIVYCTARTGDVLTVVRGQEGTTPASWVIGDFCWNGITSGQMNEVVQVAHMTDATYSPVFAGLTVENDTFFGTGGQFFIDPNNAGSQLFNFASGQYLEFVPGTGFVLVTTGSLNVTAPSGAIFSALIQAATGRLASGAFGSGDANRIVDLGDFLNASSGGSGGYFYERLPDGAIIQGQVITNTTGADIITFPNAFPNACSQVFCAEGAPTGWGSGSEPTVFGTQDIAPTQFGLYVTKWNGSTWGLVGGITTRYIAIGY